MGTLLTTKPLFFLRVDLNALVQIDWNTNQLFNVMHVDEVYFVFQGIPVQGRGGKHSINGGDEDWARGVREGGESTAPNTGPQAEGARDRRRKAAQILPDFIYSLKSNTPCLPVVVVCYINCIWLGPLVVSCQ